TGLPVLVKQLVRRVAGWRGLGDYAWTSSYSLGELWAALTAGSRQHFPRRILGLDHGGAGYHDHKGFNWRVLRALLARRTRIERTLASPIAWLPPDFASQAWFVARAPGAGAGPRR